MPREQPIDSSHEVLVVDDDTDVRELLVEFFRDLNFTVASAADGRAAIAALEREPGRYWLEVLTEGESLTSAFRSMAAELDRSQREADRYIREEVDAINELAKRIALLNSDMSKVPADREPLHERDQVIQAIRELSEQITRFQSAYEASRAGQRKEAAC